MSSNKIKFFHKAILLALLSANGHLAVADSEAGSCLQLFKNSARSNSADVVSKPDLKKKTEIGSGTIKESYSKYFTFKADTQKILNLVGTSNYSSTPNSLFFRELIQNSVDATRKQRAVLSEKSKGGSTGIFSDIKRVFGKSSNATKQVDSYRAEVNVFIDRLRNRIVVEDNGTGMGLKTIEDAFLTLGGSEKGELASGGFGIAKGALFNGSEKVFVSTVHDGFKREFTIDSNELRSNPQAKIKYNEFKVAGQNNGTIVVIELPSNSEKLPHSETDTGLYDRPFLVDDVEVNFANLNLGNSLEDIPNQIASYKTSTNIIKRSFFKKINLASPNIIKDKMHFDTWGDAEIIIDKTKLKTRLGEHYVLANGIYQFKETLRDDEHKELPYKILINLKTTIKANDQNYPFDLTRDGIRPTVAKDYKEIIDRVQEHVDRIRSEEVEKLIQGLIELHKFDLSEQFENIKQRKKLPKVVFGASSRRTNESDEIDTGTTLNLAFDAPILNNRTNLNFAGIENDSLVLFSKFSAVTEHITRRLIQIGSASKDYSANTLAKRLRNFQAGIVISKGLHGVNLSGKFNAILFNPLTLKIDGDEYQAVENIYGTIVHEIAHVLSSGHNEMFVASQQEVAVFLAKDGYNALVQSLIMEILLEHETTFFELCNRFRDASVVDIEDPE